MATLPPGGLTPGVPTLPPGGLMPGMPGSVQPPIAVLPPGGVQPPVTTLPPDRVTPGIPATPPVAALPPRTGVQPIEDRSARERMTRTDPCADPRTRTWRTADGRRVRCPDRQDTPSADETPALEVPLTPGRDLGIVSPWNAWAEANFTGVSDRRYGLDLKTRSGTLSSGLDYRFTQ